MSLSRRSSSCRVLFVSKALAIAAAPYVFRMICFGTHIRRRALVWPLERHPDCCEVVTPFQLWRIKKTKRPDSVVLGGYIPYYSCKSYVCGLYDCWRFLLWYWGRINISIVILILIIIVILILIIIIVIIIIINS